MAVNGLWRVVREKTGERWFTGQIVYAVCGTTVDRKKMKDPPLGLLHVSCSAHTLLFLVSARSLAFSLNTDRYLADRKSVV